MIDKTTRLLSGFILPFVGLLAFTSSLLSERAFAQIYLDTSASVETRIDDLISQLTLDEKLRLITADPSAGTSLDTALVERLKIPRFSMTDGPHGASFAKHFGQSATAFPSGICLASSWNADLVRKVGQAIGVETKAQGRNVILGPCLNIHRTPFGGRNFESFSEDPFLTSKLGVAYIRGVQSEGVVACAKHFACNNQERGRMTVDVQVPERALREIYLPAFRAAVVDAQVGFVMSAYNRLNGHYASENKRLLHDILKREWKFAGAVLSDWGAVHSTVPSAAAGLDLEMGGTTYFADPLKEAIERGEATVDQVDDKVRRLLRLMIASGIYDAPWQPRQNAEELYKRPKPRGEFAVSMYDLPTKFDNDPLNAPAHRALALNAAREGMVLLKNDRHLLPLDLQTVRSIAVIGPNAAWGNRGGGGSSEVQPPYIVTPLEAIMKLVPDEVDVRYERGCTFDRRYYLSHVRPQYLSLPGEEDGNGLTGEYFDNDSLEGSPTVVRNDHQVFFHWGPNPPANGLPAHDWSVRWTGKLSAPETGEYKLYLFHHGAFYSSEQGDGARLYVDGQLVVDNWNNDRSRVPSALVALDKDRPVDIRLEYRAAGPGSQPIMIFAWEPYVDNPIDRAAQLAATSDVAILCLGDNQYYCGENNDRGDLNLPGDQESLLNAVVASNPNTIVALYNGGPFVTESWVEKIPSILECWYPNQEGGAALAEILFGRTNPSGKLPDTFAKQREHYPDVGNYPGNSSVVEYAEGILVGYRHFDAKQIEPRFPFGHGLSYATFEYSDLTISTPTAKSSLGYTVECKVTNTSDRAGQEVIQLYVSDISSSLPRPPQELKAFTKLSLQPGESKVARMKLDTTSFSVYDDELDEWVIEPGEFRVLVGSSSRDIRLEESLTIAE